VHLASFVLGFSPPVGSPEDSHWAPVEAAPCLSSWAGYVGPWQGSSSARARRTGPGTAGSRLLDKHSKWLNKRSTNRRKLHGEKD